EHELMLVTHIALACLRYRQACELESQIFAKTGGLDLFTNHFEQFKAITRYVTESDRMVHRPIEELRRAQRYRLRLEPPPPIGRGTLSMVGSPRPVTKQSQSTLPDRNPRDPSALFSNTPVPYAGESGLPKCTENSMDGGLPPRRS